MQIPSIYYFIEICIRIFFAKQIHANLAKKIEYLSIFFKNGMQKMRNLRGNYFFQKKCEI